MTIDQLIEERVRLAMEEAVARLRPAAIPAARPRVLGAKEAAEYIGLSHHRLAKLREMGRGPRYRKLGVKVVYEVEDLMGVDPTALSGKIFAMQHKDMVMIHRGESGEVNTTKASRRCRDDGQEERHWPGRR